MTEPMSAAEYWNARAGDHWAATYERYDSLLGGFGEAAIDALALQPGDRVLDVGCGAGGTTLEIARRLGPNGTVLGADLSHQQIAVARERAERAGLANVEFVQADVVDHPFDPGSFDAFTSRFGVMFFADPVHAFTRLARALKPDGRASFVCWQAATDNDWMTVPIAALAKHLPLPSPVPTNAPGPFSLADADRLRSILDAAGFVGVRVESLVLEQRMGVDVDSAIEFFFETRSGVEMLADASPETKRQAIATLRSELDVHVKAGGVYLRGAVWLVTARKPS